MNGSKTLYFTPYLKSLLRKTPNSRVTVFRVWIIILAFVGIQLSWNLRPFLGDRKEDFKLFRKYKGNFYTAIVYSFEQLLSKEKTEGNKNYNNEIDKNNHNNKDATDFLELLEE